MAKMRLHHFDMLKGIAIFLVVVGHVLTMCIRDIDNAVLFKFVEKIHMPIFFFISGYFTYKLNEKGRLKMPNLLSRAKQLLIPFFVVSTLWIFYFPKSGLQSPFISTWEGLYFSVGKNGYWFTLCLFEIILLYSILTPLFSMCQKIISKVALMICVWILLGISKDIVPEVTCALLGLSMVFDFFPIFMVGVLVREGKTTFDKIIISRNWITVALLVGGVMMYYVCWPWEVDLPSICLDISRQILYICVAVVGVAVVKPWSEDAFKDNNPNGTFMSRLWVYLGTQSLAIYLLHYFFLFPMAVFREPLIAMNLNVVPTLIVAVFFASIIIAVTLCVNYIISRSKLLALLLTGKIN